MPTRIKVKPIITEIDGITRPKWWQFWRDHKAWKEAEKLAMQHIMVKIVLKPVGFKHTLSNATHKRLPGSFGNPT